MNTSYGAMMQSFKITLYLLGVCVSLTLSSTVYSQPFAGGSGTELDPYQIETAVQLDSLRHYLNSSFILNNDIDLTTYTSDPSGGGWNGGEGWMPLPDTSTTLPGFLGNIDGQNYTISGLHINRPSTNSVGLFASLWSGSVKNLRIRDANITGKSTGILTAFTNTVTIENVHVHGLITSILYSGGIVGISRENLSITNSSAEVEINTVFDLTGAVIRSSVMGGLVGWVAGISSSGENICDECPFLEISDSYSIGTFSNTSSLSVGGLVGWYAQGNMNSSYASTSLSVSDSTYQMPLIANEFNELYTSIGSISNSFWKSDVVPNVIDSSLGVPLTPDEMRLQSSFINWDFNSTWVSGTPNANTFPYLQSFTPDTLPGFQIVFAGGSGTVEDPFQIESAIQLDSVRHHLNGHFELVNDIDLNPYTNDSTGGSWNDGEGWLPIGDRTSPFSGTFDGGNNSISNLFINSTEDEIGLFGRINASSTISYLKLENANITGDQYVGGIAGFILRGKIENSFVSGSINGNNSTGAIAGFNSRGLVQTCHTLADIIGAFFNGGIVGTLFEGDLYQNYALGRVTGNVATGGILGYNDGGKVQESFSANTVINNGTFAGGLIGESVNNATVLNSFWNTDISNQESSAGGQGLTNAEMRQSSFFLSWDFNSNWQMLQNNPLSFPYLRNNQPDSIPGFVTGGIADFNGLTSYGVIPDTSAIDFTNALSVELWVNFDDVSRDSAGAQFMTLFMKDSIFDSYGMSINTSTTDKTLTFFHNGLSEFSTSFNWTDLTVDTWYHIAATYDGFTTRIYIDGAERATQAVTGNINTNDDDLYIGYVPGVNNFVFDGTLADLRLWSDARTQTEIQNNMNLLISGKEQGLVGNWIPRIAGYEGGLDYAESTLPITYSDMIIEDITFPPLKSSFGGSEGWRFIGAPGDSTNYADVLEPIWTQGFTGADTESGSSNVYFYDEVNRTWGTPSNASNRFGTNSDSESSLGKGSLVYVYADDDNDGNDDPFPKTLSLEENLFILYDETITLSYTETEIWGNDGWNLVSNPYPVSLYWLDIVADSANFNVEPFIFIWDHSMFGGFGSYAANYGSPTPVGLPGAAAFDGRIAPFQSFWVKAKGEGAELRLTKDHFITNTQPLKRNIERKAFLSFNLTGEGMESGTSLLFDEKAESQGIPKLYSLSADHAEIFFEDEHQSRWLSKYIQNIDEDSLTFDLNMDVTVDGQYFLEWDLSSLPKDWQLELLDLKEQQVYDLREESSLELLISTSAKSTQNELRMPTAPGQLIKSKSKNSPRFRLIIRNAVLTDNEDVLDLPTEFSLSQNYPNPFNPSTTIEYALPKATQVRLEVFDILGRQVMTLVNNQKQAGYHEVQMDARHLANGVYIYRILASDFVQTRTLTLIK